MKVKRDWEQQIRRHLSIREDRTYTEISGFPKGFDPFSEIPTNTYMIGQVGTNTKTVTQLLMQGVIEIDGERLQSPVKKVTYSNMKTGRWRLVSNIADAESLIAFTSHVAKLVLPGMILHRPGGISVTLTPVTDKAENRIHFD